MDKTSPNGCAVSEIDLIDLEDLEDSTLLQSTTPQQRLVLGMIKTLGKARMLTEAIEVQMEVFLGGYTKEKKVVPIRVDFLLPKFRLVIEVDGEAHNTEKVMKRDEIRDFVTQGLGLYVLHIENRQLTDPEMKALLYKDLQELLSRPATKKERERIRQRVSKARKALMKGRSKAVTRLAHMQSQLRLKGLKLRSSEFWGGKSTILRPRKTSRSKTP